MNVNQEQWERFAQEDALFYIATNATSEKIFWEQGVTNHERYIRPLLEKYAIGREVAVDFGSGIGRHTFPMAEDFQQVIGVDVSLIMVQKAQEICGARQLQNVRFVSSAAFFASGERADFVYFAHVFQHIESFEEIKNMVRQLRQQTRGYAYLHFDTRPQTWLYRLHLLLPDWALGRAHRRGIRRIRRSPSEIRKVFDDVGFRIVEEQQPNTAYHFFLVK